MEKTEEHFQEAMKENKNSFHAVDPDGDGKRELMCRNDILTNSEQTCSTSKSVSLCGPCCNHKIIYCLVKTQTLIL